MASGGGTHPSHLSIATPRSLGSNSSSSLQTPDNSSLFVTTLGSGGGGVLGRSDGTMGGSGTAADQEPHSFTSLEELLDVTGINSMELGHHDLDGMKETSSSMRGGHGVNSLQMLAREVEMNSSQQGLNDGLAGPPTKRPRLEPSSNNFISNSSSALFPTLDKLSHSPSNIRVQALHSSPPPPPPAAAHSSTNYLSPVPSPSPPCHPQLAAAQTPASLSASPATQSPLHSSSSSSNPPTPIVSLLDKRLSSPGSDVDGFLDSQKEKPFGNTGLVAGPPKMLGRPMHSPPPYSSTAATISSSSRPSQSFSPQNLDSTDYLQKGISGGFANSNHTFPSSTSPNNFHTLNSGSMGQATSWASKSQVSQSENHLLPNTFSSSMSVPAMPVNSHPATSLRQLVAPRVENRSTSPVVHNSAHLRGDGVASNFKLKPSPTPPVSTPSQVAESINSNSKAVVVQLIQLYKQYQEANDQQGMARVREQINFLVTAQQKILAAKNNILKTGAGGASNNPTNQSLVGGKPPGSLESSMGGADVKFTSIDNKSEQQQQANKILGQLALKKAQHVQQNAGTSLPMSFSSSAAPHSSTLSINASRNQSSFGLGTSGPGLRMGAGEMSGCNGRMTAGSNPVEEVGVSSGLSGRGLGSSGAVFGLPTVSTTSSVSVSTQQNSVQTGQNPGLKNSQEDAQKTLKQLQLLMANLPETKRPKNLQELKVFIQQYSSLIAKGNVAPPTNSQPSAASTVAATLPSYSASLERSQPQVTPSNAGHLSHPQNSSGKPFAPPSFSFLPNTTPKNSLATGAAQNQGKLMTQQGGLMAHSGGLSGSSLTSQLTGSDANSSKQQQQHHHQASSSSLSLDSQPRVNVTAMAVETAAAAQASLNLKSASSSTSATPPVSGGQSINLSATSKSGGIQPGVATPLPSGVTLETLGVLCRLPDNDLLKLNLPPPLLSAIKVWKARQGSGKAKVSNTANKNNIPVLIPPPPAYSMPSAGTTNNNSISSASRSSHNNNHHHHSHSGNSTGSGGSGSSSMAMAKADTHIPLPSIPKSLLGGGQPNVLPSGAGFPPRSLHAFIPRPPPSMGVAPQTTSQHMTRFKVKMEQHKAETERLQALQKALQSSEEARIAYRFSAHLEKMHSQLMNPDTVSGFKSRHDVLARLLPYHIYAEPEPPPAAVEKADAVFESVAQVLLSRSRGLKSRYDKIMLKTESEGGLEQSKMKFQLEQLFIKGEQERIQRENQEKKEAEQIAADLSTMAETADAFDDDFSFGDVFSPLMSLSSGIT